MITEEKTTNKKILFKIVITLIIIICLIILARFAYAKYIAQINGQATAQIAQWNFAVKDGTNTTGVVINLAETRQNDSEKVDSNYIAPRNKRCI